MVTDQKRVSDGFLELSAGMDAGKAPNLIPGNAIAYAINTTVRGGWPMPRPGWKKHNLTFYGNGMDGDSEITAQQSQDTFEDGRFQTGDGYTSDQGNGHAISMQGGRVFSVDLRDFSVSEISIPTDLNPSDLTQAWSWQAENYFIIQDGYTKPFIYNGGSARRATETEIPVGRQGVYYMGRIWIAKGRSYVAGDIVYGSSGTQSLGLRDSILKMTENTFLNEGGAFGVPAKAGDIVGLVPVANINTALGQGELLVFTQNNVFATLVPQDRTTWKNTSQPLQRMLQLANGAFGQDSIVNVNEDLFYRSNDGIRSLAYSVRNSGQWGNTPISGEVSPILEQDPQEFLKFGSGVNFDNRLLMTVSPGLSVGHRTYHRGLVVLDFDLITGMSGKSPPAWEGIWTGLKFLKVFTVMHDGVERCMAWVLNDSDQIELWELTKDAQFDHNGTEDVRITWSFDTRSMDFGNKFDSNRIFAGDLFIDRLSGNVDFDVDYRPDSYPCYRDWETWSECAKVSLCQEDFVGCSTLQNFQEQYRPNHQLLQPADDFDPVTQHLFRVGYEFQFRVSITGFCRIKQCRFNAYQTQQAPYGDNVSITGCPSVTCCKPDPYNYTSHGE